MTEPGGSATGRFVRGALTEHLPYKLVALFLAIVLWAVVRFEQPSEGLVTVRVVTIVPDGSAAVAGPPVEVRALVAARGRDLLALHRHPPVIRHAVTGASGDTVTIALHPRDVVLPAGVTAIVRDVRPSAVRLSLVPRAGGDR